MSSRDIIFSKTLSGRKPREGWGAGGREERRERGERVFNSKRCMKEVGKRIYCNLGYTVQLRVMCGEIED